MVPRWLRVAAPGFFGLLALAFLARTVFAGRHELARAFESPRWGSLAALVMSSAVAMVWIAFSWQSVLLSVNIRFERSRTAATYFAGEIGKYIPGGIWPVVGRGELAARDRSRPDRANVYGSVLLSLGYLFLAGLALGALTSAFAIADQRGSKAPLLLLAALPVGLIALHERIGGVVLQRLLRMFRKDPSVFVLPPWTTSMRLLVRYTPAWIAITAASWAAGDVVGAHPPLALLATATCLGWVAGFLFLPAPGGMGAREAVFAAILGTSVASGRAAAMAVLLRLAFVAVDGVGAAAGSLWIARHKND
jgi:glycosyltransferase 2 family protein